MPLLSTTKTSVCPAETRIIAMQRPVRQVENYQLGQFAEDLPLRSHPQPIRSRHHPTPSAAARAMAD
jgi:hypothetical protein